jgi:16S rRNA processing protein RimM
MADLVRIGQITSSHGVRGEVRVFPLTNFPERFATLRTVLLGDDARPVRVKYRTVVKNMIILSIEGVEDRDASDKLRGQYLQVPMSEVFPLPEGHYYVFDLIGLDVVDPEGNPLGRLVEVNSSSPVHDLYVVERPDRKRYMVPAVQKFVKQIDLPGGKVVIQPIPGLLED